MRCAGLVAIAIIAAGCSNDSSPTASSTSQSATPSSQAPSPSPTLPAPSSAQPQSFDQSTCLDISFAKDNLMVANNPEKARKYADTLEKYGPPDSVKAAIEHFVTTGGAQPNDADLNSNRDLITNWIKQACPNVNP
ncbi:hypothetical protein A9X03_21820 [Mycobacterium sp. E1715]|nr:MULTISPECIES: hypothetical protein [unclassified Mycobacterium]OBG65453.1 hypothetical protein A5704_12220 [Mycobacterium sp. E735]OBH15965.1 hypothetical protein A9X03_21820 [Mycobacterium sp. E1715]OBG65216.1 hypothetical protein A5703_16415 [Mycobacterium sp. E188]OBG70443.1 hypothetical protein A9X05_03410 [Mycobacterium sp. E3298]OBH37775.1 hypothetical protein A5691_25590 [Mycobacterium sp. E183]